MLLLHLCCQCGKVPSWCPPKFGLSLYHVSTSSDLWSSAGTGSADFVYLLSSAVWLNHLVLDLIWNTGIVDELTLVLMMSDDVFSYCRFYNSFYNCYTVLIFALLVANWPFCINKFDWLLDLLGNYARGNRTSYSYKCKVRYRRRHAYRPQLHSHNSTFHLITGFVKLSLALLQLVVWRSG